MIERKEEYSQVCVWPGTIVGDEQDDFVKFMQDQFGARVQYLEEVLTLPDEDSNGQLVAETGGRTDLIFAVHNEDVGKFAIPRLLYGIRWIEDALDNNPEIYSEDLVNYRTW